MNPWLQIPLSDYESHMALPAVDQARLIADVLRSEIEEHTPATLAVLGCAGGNGLDCVPPDVRVTAVDINPTYVAECRKRFAGRPQNVTFITHDIEGAPIACEPVDMVFAALVFEYVDVARTLRHVTRLLREDGMLSCILQLASGGKAPITPSPYSSLAALDGHMHLVPPDTFTRLAAEAGLTQVHAETRSSSAGKEFAVMRFVNSDAGQERR